MMEYAYSFHYWGPLLFKTKLNDEDLIKVKNICKKDSAKKYVEYLAGDIEHEYQIDKIILDRILQPYMFLFKQAYSNWYQEDIKGNIYVTNAWVNYMKPGDYNPVHTHDKCDFSAVVYIDIPKELRKEIDEYKGQSDGPGAINFLYGEFNPYFISQICGKPNVAELYMFPYGLRHMVNPHKSNCERVSVGINFAIKGERHDT